MVVQGLLPDLVVVSITVAVTVAQPRVLCRLRCRRRHACDGPFRGFSCCR